MEVFVKIQFEEIKFQQIHHFKLLQVFFLHFVLAFLRFKMGRLIINATNCQMQPYKKDNIHITM